MLFYVKNHAFRQILDSFRSKRKKPRAFADFALQLKGRALASTLILENANMSKIYLNCIGDMLIMFAGCSPSMSARISVVKTSRRSGIKENKRVTRKFEWQDEYFAAS